jgi:hypothetical protein
MMTREARTRGPRVGSARELCNGCGPVPGQWWMRRSSSGSTMEAAGQANWACANSGDQAGSVGSICNFSNSQLSTFSW